MSYCGGSQSNYQQGSQSQKMSIGMVVDLAAKPRYGSTKKTEVSNKQAKKGMSNQDHIIVGQSVKRDFKASGSINMCKEHVREGSTRSKMSPLTGSVRMKDINHIEKQSSRPTMSCDEQARQSHQCFPNPLMAQPGAGKKIEVGAFSGKEGKGNFTTDRRKEFSSEDKQEVCMPVKDVVQEEPIEKENRSKETLRMKLQEILDTVPSSSKRYGNSRTVEAGVNEVMHKQTQEGDAHFKLRQNSDTIESDSENADMTTRRVMIRPLAKKRVTAKTSPRILKTKSLSCNKAERPGKNVLSSAKKSARSQPREVNFEFLMPEKSDNVKRGSGIKPNDMLSHETETLNIQQEIFGCKRPPQTEEFPLGGRMVSPEYACQTVNLEPEETTKNINFNHSPIIREKNQHQMEEFPLSSGMIDAEFARQNVNLEPEGATQNVNFNDSPNNTEKNQQQDGGCPVPLDEPANQDFSQQSPVHHDTDSSSPLVKMTSTAHSSPMSSSPPVVEKMRDVHGSVKSKGGASLMGTCVFKSTPVTEDHRGSSDEETTPTNTDVGTPELSTEGKEAQNEFFSPEERVFDRIGKVPYSKKVYQVDVPTSPETEAVRKPMLFRNKRQRSQGVVCSDLIPTLHSPRASETTDDALTEGLKENPDDGLARVVSLLGLALERVNNKIMSMTSKRCSGILMSAAKEIHSHLQDVESLIQMDVGKLTSLNKSKRKHMEATLKEQHLNLNAIYEKFKEEIRNHLQDCRGQMDLLEAQNVEIKASFERQKTSHRKLLLQAKTAVETHLNDAQRRITSVHKLKRQKMLQLKASIAECLEDGMSS